MSIPFKDFRVGTYVKGKSTTRDYWRVHLKPPPQSDDEYVAQSRFLEQAIWEKIERDYGRRKWKDNSLGSTQH